ncbi:MAG: M1 family aminopeptidase [candidate division WOR-3 bacterium]
MDIILFEIRFWLRTRAFYFNSFILILFGFLLITSDFIKLGSTETPIFKNSPYMISYAYVITLFFGAFISAYLNSNSAYRDFRDNVYELFFTSPIKKSSYFWGRFIGSTLILFVIFIMVLLGMFLGNLAPWVPKEKIGPINLWSYINPLLQFGIIDTFFMATVFYSLTSLTRSAIIGYLGGVAFIVFYIISGTLSATLKWELLAIILDPLGIAPLIDSTEYWTTSQLNTLQIPWTREIVLNRLIWSFVGFMVILWAYYRFSFKVGIVKSKKEKVKGEVVRIEKPTFKPIFSVFSFMLHTLRFEISIFYKSYVVLAIVLFSIITLVISFTGMNMIFDTPVLPATYILTDFTFGNALLFIAILSTFLVGEIIHRDAENKTFELVYSSPMALHLFIGRFLAVILFFAFLMLIYIAVGVGFQIYKGYYNFELGVYFKRLFLEVWTYAFMFSALAFFIHSLINYKFLAHMVFMAYFLAVLFLSNLETKVFQMGIFHYPFVPRITYSDFYGYGHFLKPLLLYKAYWSSLTVIFITLGLLSQRLKIGIPLIKAIKMNFSRIYAFILLSSGIIFIGLFSYLYYNHYVLNEFKSREEERLLSVEYERKYSKYERMHIPKITEVFFKVDIYPYKRSIYTYGKFKLKNKFDIPIETLFVNVPNSSYKRLEFMKFSIPVKRIVHDTVLGVDIYTFEKPLNPSDSFYVEFKISCEPNGIIDGHDTRCRVFYNGTFTNGDYPTFGYDRSMELTNRTLRKKYELPERERFPNPDDEFYKYYSFVRDADWVNFEAILCTSPDQVALSPGDLVKTWRESNRNCFKYKSQKPILHYYAFVSGKYKVDSTTYKGIKLTIYYIHPYNIDKMFKAMKTALDYLQTLYPYPHGNLRIVEFPRVSSFAQSLATIIPFSEGIGFLADVRKGDIDYVSFVTGHEVGHQWWGHILSPAYTKGVHFLVESFAEYTGIRVMEEIYGEGNVGKFLKHEIDRYLKGRKSETYKETPLYLSEGQMYVHYNKGGLINYSTADYIGFSRFDSVLKEFIKNYGYKSLPYPTPLDFLNALYPTIPDTLLNQIKGWYERIIVYDFNVENFKYENGVVIVSYSFKKFEYDEKGNEREIKPDDVVEVGFYKGKDLKGVKRVRIKDTNGKLRINLDFKPDKVVFDPYHKLINRRIQ